MRKMAKLKFLLVVTEDRQAILTNVTGDELGRSGHTLL